MKISNTPIRQTITAPTQTESTAKAAESKLTKSTQAESTAPADNFVSIKKHAASSDIDMNKVNEISALLADGKLELDLDILSDAILEMHRQ